MRSSGNATELYIEMYSEVKKEGWRRQCTDPESAQSNPTWEARPGREFELRFPKHNVQIAVPMDPRWAVANALHFFSATEDAEMLCNFNRHAERFAPGGKWVGAYGAIAVPQVNECVERLKAHPHSRRAVVSMGGSSPQDINRPACWSFLQFLLCRNGLCMLVYQRSLNLSRVMPYDLVVLSNLLLDVARRVEQPVGSLLWTVGSLHCVELVEPNYAGHRLQSLTIETEPATCLAALRQPELYEGVWKCANFRTSTRNG